MKGKQEKHKSKLEESIGATADRKNGETALPGDRKPDNTPWSPVRTDPADAAREEPRGAIYCDTCQRQAKHQIN